MALPIPPEAGDFSEIRKHETTSPTEIIRRGAFALLETNGKVVIRNGTGGSRPTTNVLSGVTTFYGVVNKTSTEADPVSDASLQYGGQSNAPLKVHVSLLASHREVILPTIDDSGNEKPEDAVPANIGRTVGLKYQNYSIAVGSLFYWIYAGALVSNTESDGIIVGLAGKGRVIVRLKRSFFAELQ